MSPATPTTQQISDNIVAQIETQIGQTIPFLPKTFSRVLAKALAGVFVQLYKYAGFMFLQIFITTATIKPTVINGRTVRPLVEWGILAGVGEPGGATRAQLLVDVTVENQAGFLDSGALLLNTQTGVTYAVVASVALNAPVVQATVEAVADQAGQSGRGAIGNMEPGETLSFANPLPNVARDTVVDSQVVTASDAEAEEAYRQRVIDRFRRRPQGGAYADYEQWGETPSGILNIYPYTGALGVVEIYVEATEASSGSPDGIPTPAQLVEVEEAIEFDVDGLASNRPANAFVNVQAITRTAFTAEVSGLSVTDPATVQGQIDDAVADYLFAREPWIAGVSQPPRADSISTTSVTGVVDDIVNAAGGTFTGLVLKEGGSPITVRQLGDGEKAKSGGVTYV